MSPCLFNLYAEYIMRNGGLNQAQAGLKIAGRNVNNLRHAGYTTLMPEREELKSLFVCLFVCLFSDKIHFFFISYMILYMFRCHSPKSSHPLPFPQSAKDCSIHLRFFCYLAYRVIVTIFLNSIYMC